MTYSLDDGCIQLIGTDMDMVIHYGKIRKIAWIQMADIHNDGLR